MTFQKNCDLSENGPVKNRLEVGEAEKESYIVLALLPYHNFSKNSSFVCMLMLSTCTQ